MDRHKSFFKTKYFDTWINGVRRYELTDGRIEKHFLNLIASTLNRFKNPKILEVGVGTGQPFGEFISSKGNARFYAFDINGRLLREAIRNCGAKIKPAVADAEAIPFANEAFDITYCSRTLFFLENAAQAIQEMFRVTRRGGVVIFDMQNMDSVAVKYALLKAHFRLNLMERPLNLFKKFVLRRSPQSRFIYTKPVSAKSVNRLLDALTVRTRDFYCFNIKGEFRARGLSTHYPKIIFMITK